MKIITLICAVLAWCNIASAKLGETLAEVEARYGKPKSSYTNNTEIHAAFVYAGYNVDVFLLDNHSIREKVYYDNPSNPGFTDAECLALAKALTGKTDWLVDHDDVHEREWSCASFRATKLKLDKGNQLEVSGKAYTDFLEAMTRQKELDSIKNIEDKFGSASRSK